MVDGSGMRARVGWMLGINICLLLILEIYLLRWQLIDLSPSRHTSLFVGRRPVTVPWFGSRFLITLLLDTSSFCQSSTNP